VTASWCGRPGRRKERQRHRRRQRRSYFDTSTADHYHFFCEATGKLQDIPAQQLSVSGLPLPPAGTKVRQLDIIVRIRPAANV